MSESTDVGVKYSRPVSAFADPTAWLWDPWFAFADGVWHGYCLRAERQACTWENRKWHSHIAHATSIDFRQWSTLNIALRPSTQGFDDKTIWGGCTVQHPNGSFHLYYTGTCCKDGHAIQRIGHAVSADGRQFSQVDDGKPALKLDGDIYETSKPDDWHDRSMRDPFVMYSKNTEQWLMFFTARISGQQPTNERGAIGLATSADLSSWKLQSPAATPGFFAEMETPQVLEIGGKWFCLFSSRHDVWSDRYQSVSGLTPITGSHCLASTYPEGPWEISAGPWLTHYCMPVQYANKIICVENEYFLTGFVSDAGNNVANGYEADIGTLVLNRLCTDDLVNVSYMTSP